MGCLRAAASTKRGLTPRRAVGYIPAASKSEKRALLRARTGSIRDDCVAKEEKEEKADKQPAAAAEAAAPIGRFAALKARATGLKRWALATRLRAILTCGALAIAFIGLASVAALAFR